jgi:hypothetical protein
MVGMMYNLTYYYQTSGGAVSNTVPLCAGHLLMAVIAILHNTWDDGFPMFERRWHIDHIPGHDCRACGLIRAAKLPREE